jgi:Matrixin/Domain of unknown function (DUF4214)
MHYSLALILTLALMMSSGAPTRLEIWDTFELEAAAQPTRQIKWPKRTIEVSLSNSLLSPGVNIKAGSDVVGAVRRGLARWSTMANINFVVTWTSATTVSPVTGGDGISLITIADTTENEAFNADSTTGRTRLFYDPENGKIAEADISINPRPRSEEGADLQFSTDGSPGTYDLEATFTHEIGHLLGLDHSAVLASTMQSRQAFNGTFGLPALSERTLSEDDRQRVLSLYGPNQKLGRIEGRLIDNRLPNSFTPLTSVNVWVENVATGRVVTSTVSNEDGVYKLEGLVPGQYRVLAAPRDDSAQTSGSRFRSFEIANQTIVKADSPTTLNYNLVPPQTSVPGLNARLIGLNAELSTVAVPIVAGKKIKLYLGGEGIDQIPGTGILINSPYFTVDPSSLTREQFGTSYPVVSFEVTALPNTPFGDYTIKLQSNSGETAFVPGGLTVDPGVVSPVANPIDDYRFFISQHFNDLLGHEPGSDSLEKLVAPFVQCGSRNDCLRAKRLELSTTLLTQEVPTTGVFLYGLYTAGLGRRPRLAEYEADRNAIRSNHADVEDGRLALALAFVQRTEFQRKYPTSLKAAEFVDQLLKSLPQRQLESVEIEHEKLLSLYNGNDSGRAAILNRLVSEPGMIEGHYNQAFVMVQYFSYLRRDPDESGFNFWVNSLKSKPLRDSGAARSMVCAFLSSTEYQNRFGMLATTSGSECAN